MKKLKTSYSDKLYFQKLNIRDRKKLINTNKLLFLHYRQLKWDSYNHKLKVQTQKSCRQEAIRQNKYNEYLSLYKKTYILKKWRKYDRKN